MALLDWGPAAWKLADREEWIGLVALKADLHPEPSWPELQERCQHNPNIPFRALLKHRAK